MTQEEAAREKLAISICERYAILEENRPVIETLAYSDKYRKLLDEICLDKKKLDEEIKDELEGKINLNGLADTGSKVNVMPYRIYMDLRRKKVKKVNSGIEMINHSLAEPMGLLKDALCQVGVATIIANGVLDIIDQVMSTYDGVCHQTFRAARTNINTLESDSDDKEEYAAALNPFHQIRVWKKAVSFLGSLPVPLQHVDWKPEYNGYHKNEEEGIG
ncbi:hypothetical protein Tco_1039153 [Tanacetum coccineum]